MSDIVPYYSRIPSTRRKALSREREAAMGKARVQAEVFEYRTLEAIDIAKEYITGMSLLDYTLTATCGDRPGFEMEMRSIVPMMNVAFALSAAKFMQGRD